MTPDGPELMLVEQPLVDQLVGMGWQYVPGDVDDPRTTQRGTFREVLLREDLRGALRRINVDDHGRRWLDASRIEQAAEAIENVAGLKLIEANQTATELLLDGVLVPGLEGWDQGRDQVVRYIDWDNPSNNIFRVVTQFRVDEVGGHVRQYILPDVVLFVNGIPLVVIECKSPNLQDPLEKAFDQIHRYANRRHEMGLVRRAEGNEKLFHYNQIVVGTCGSHARAGTITSRDVDYLEWKSTAPLPEEEVKEALGVERLDSQQRLVAGMLRPETLLEIVRHFTLFDASSGRTIKIVARYQQYRAVKKTIDRLMTGNTRKADGEADRRGGIVWHTQGSGKSLSMVFLIRMMRSIPELRAFKVVIITDRRDLEKQLSDTADLIGEPLVVAKGSQALRKALSEKGPGLVFGLIQKYRSAEDEAEDEFPVLNTDPRILVIVDEAHRSHSSALHANLLRALPNCVKIGFTGTPILMGDKKRTHQIFGPFIDSYTIRQSQDDGATVPIFYEGRTAEGAVSGGNELDELFENHFRERTDKERDEIKKRWATKGNVLEARRLIEAKARDMLRLYVERTLPNGFKAQVVATSRRAAVRYAAAFEKARKELLAAISEEDQRLAELDDEALMNLPARTQYHARALRVKDRIESLEFAPIISGEHNDPADWAEWTDRSKIMSRIERFKKPFPQDDPEKGDPLGIIFVKSMLLTGFDAPILQMLALDRPIKEAELLQAIARTNRTYPNKSHGLIVDYYGISNHLAEALAVYQAEDVQGALSSLQDNLPRLRLAHQRVRSLFTSRGIDRLEDVEGCVALLADEKLRAEFRVALKKFLGALDTVMPRPEGLPFLRDAKHLGQIQARARNLYREDAPLIGKEVGQKVARLIDQHLIAMGIETKIEPTPLLSRAFEREVAGNRSAKAKASEMEHAIRHHIRKHMKEDPELYESLSKRLEKIVRDLKGQWELLTKAFEKLREEIAKGRADDPYGLPADTAPFFYLVVHEAEESYRGDEETLKMLADEIPKLMEVVRERVGKTGFWKNPVAQEELRGEMWRFLDDHAAVPMDSLDLLADRMLDLARENRHRFGADE